MDDQKQPESHPLDIPDFLVRDPVTNTAEFMMSEQAQEIMKEKAKPQARPAKTETKPKAAKAKAPAKAQAAKTKPAKKAKSAKPVAKPKKVAAKKADKSEKDQFGLRKGSTRSTAAAMYARKSGATLEEVKEAVGSIQLNVLKELEATGFVVEKEKQTRSGKRPLTRYWLKAAK